MCIFTIWLLVAVFVTMLPTPKGLRTSNISIILNRHAHTHTHIENSLQSANVSIGNWQLFDPSQALIKAFMVVWMSFQHHHAGLSIATTS